MARLFRFVIFSLAYLATIPLVNGAEKRFVNFRTSEIVSGIPKGEEASFGLITNRKHLANELEPIDVGNFWLYESRVKFKGKEHVDDRYVVRISQHLQLGNRKWYEYKNDSVGIIDKPYYLHLDNDAVYYKKSIAENPGKWIPRKPQKGQAYTNGNGFFTISETQKVVDTLFGKLKCVELIHVHNRDVLNERGNVTGQEKAKDIYWYHPGIGVVAIISKDSRDVLIGFNVGAGSGNAGETVNETSLMPSKK